jgi:hypothetical protein
MLLIKKKATIIRRNVNLRVRRESTYLIRGYVVDKACVALGEEVIRY